VKREEQFQTLLDFIRIASDRPVVSAGEATATANEELEQRLELLFVSPGNQR